MAADGGGLFWGGRPLTRDEKRIAGSSKMAADGGGLFFGGRPLTRDEKRIAGSSKMAADGGSVFWGGRPLTDLGKSRAQKTKKRLWNDGVSFFLITSSIVGAKLSPNRELFLLQNGVENLR